MRHSNRSSERKITILRGCLLVIVLVHCSDAGGIARKLEKVGCHNRNEDAAGRLVRPRYPDPDARIGARRRFAQ